MPGDNKIMKTKEIDRFSEVPQDYPLCINYQCPRASTCLRQLVAQEAADSIKFLMIINPKHQATLKKDCPYYRSSTKVRFAKGFMNIIENLTQKQIREVIPQLINRFSERTYYRIRKGERLLSPAEQQSVVNILKKYGAAEPIVFDDYIEGYEW